MFLKIAAALFLAVFTGWIFQIRLDGDHETRYRFWRDLLLGRTSLLVEPLLIPCWFLFTLVMFCVYQRKDLSGVSLTAYLSTFALRFAVYYALLLLLLPLLRRIISPRACAALWLVPNLMWITDWIISYDAGPSLVLTVPRNWLIGLGIAWAAGFVVVQGWQIVSHLCFRRRLLGPAVPVKDPAILAGWQHAQSARQVARKPIPVLVSPHTATPVTVGLFRRSLRLVLPHTDYTEQELRMIFRHEVRHIERQDSQTKAFLGFCCALCWFDPLMWIARRKASDDLELSCDELILHWSDEFERKKYADLLLRTAGDSRGYSTCLSAAASSLRYRLSRVMRPGKRLSGAVVVGLAVALLVMSGNTVALADAPITAGSLLPDSPQELEYIHLAKDWDGTYGYRTYYGLDEEALRDYLDTLDAQKIYGVVAFDSTGPELQLTFRERTWWGEIEQETSLEFHEDFLWVRTDGRRTAWALPQEPDWDYLASLMDPTAPGPEIDEPPELHISLHDRNGILVTVYSVPGRVVSIEQDGVARAVEEDTIDQPIEIPMPWRKIESIHLTLSLTPLTYCEVLCEPLDGSPSYTFASSAKGRDDTDVSLFFKTPGRFTVTGTAQGEHGTIFQMEYIFICK